VAIAIGLRHYVEGGVGVLCRHPTAERQALDPVELKPESAKCHGAQSAR
jgi:hypothetical protein